MLPLPATFHFTATFRARYKNELRKAFFATQNRLSLRFRFKTCFPGSLPFHFRFSREGVPIVNLSQQMKVFQPTGIYAGKPCVEDSHHRDTKFKNWFAPDRQTNVFSFAYPDQDVVANFPFLIPGIPS
jgi:hypothetical protein